MCVLSDTWQNISTIQITAAYVLQQYSLQSESQYWICQYHGRESVVYGAVLPPVLYLNINIITSLGVTE